MKQKHASAETLDAADGEALSWFVRNQASGRDDPAFDAWCAIDPRHEAAYARVERLWGSAALGAAARRLKPRPTAGTTTGVVLSAALLLMAGAGGLKLSGASISLPADHATRVGRMQTVSLDDGTRLTLDSGSAIDVDYSDRTRRVRLREGRIFVAVAPDARPFSVVSGEAVIRDIGTSFSVDRRGEVAVKDGEVEVGADGLSQRIRAGQRGGLGDAGLLPLQTGDALEDFGWTRRWLYFSNRPLGEVVTELRRYHRGWIVLGDDKIAGMRISGGLRLDEPATAMEELARLSGGRLTRVSDAVLILR